MQGRSKSRFSGRWPRRSASPGNRSTASSPSVSDNESDNDSTPRATPDPHSVHGPPAVNPLKRHRSVSIGTPDDAKSPASSSGPASTGSWFKRFRPSSESAALGEPERRANTPASSDSTYSPASPPPATPTTGPISTGQSDVVLNLPLGAHQPLSPPQQAEGSMLQAGRLGGSAANNIGQAPGTWAAAEGTAELWAGIVAKLAHFSSAVKELGEIHPYLTAATSVINAIVKPIVQQDTRDDEFEELLEEMKVTYEHVNRACGIDNSRRKTPNKRQTELLKRIFRESEQCALFIQNEYTRNFWSRARRNAWHGKKVDREIDRYKSIFFRLRATCQDEYLHHQKGSAILDKLMPLRIAALWPAILDDL